jgi:hypothetical protein
MFGGQGELGTFAAQVKIGVAPAVEFTGTPQGLTRATGVGVFAGVVNQQDGQVKLTLEFPEVRKQRSDLSGIVFIDSVEPDQRIEDQQDRLESLHGMSEALAVRRCVQSERGCSYYFDRERFKSDLSGASDAFQSLAHDRQGVFGWKEQHLAGASHGKLPQAGRAGSDAHGHIQSEKAFAALRFTAEDAHGLIGPKTFDQPLGLGAGRGELAGPLNGKAVHDFLEGLGSRAKTSK